LLVCKFSRIVKFCSDVDEHEDQSIVVGGHALLCTR